MSLPTPNLDDLRFQRDLVDEARRRIVRYCPEWTEYNVSDPGCYADRAVCLDDRDDDLPAKSGAGEELHQVPRDARCAACSRPAARGHSLRSGFRRPCPSDPRTQTVATDPAAIRRVATRPGDKRGRDHLHHRCRPGDPDAAATGATAAEQTISARTTCPDWASSCFTRSTATARAVATPSTWASPKARTSAATSCASAFECEETEAVGVRPRRPALVWECSLGNGVWQEVPRQHPARREATRPAG